jgi:hypothetical protein
MAAGLRSWKYCRIDPKRARARAEKTTSVTLPINRLDVVGVRRLERILHVRSCRDRTVAVARHQLDRRR